MRRAPLAGALLTAAALTAAACGGEQGVAEIEPEAIVVTAAGSEVVTRWTEPLPAADTLPGGQRRVRLYRAGDSGRVRIELVGERVRILEVLPAAGWRWKITEEEDDEVEVSFYRGAEEIEFEVEIERGELRVEVDRED